MSLLYQLNRYRHVTPGCGIEADGGSMLSKIDIRLVAALEMEHY